MYEVNAVSVDWRKSKSCASGNCVEVGALEGGIAVRDSKDPQGSVLRYTVAEWRDFIAGAKNGDFDDLID